MNAECLIYRIYPEEYDCQKVLSSTKKSLDDWPSSVTPGIQQDFIFFEQCVNQSADCEIPNMPLWASVVAPFASLSMMMMMIILLYSSLSSDVVGMRGLKKSQSVQIPKKLNSVNH